MEDRTMTTYRAFIAARSCAESLLAAHYDLEEAERYHLKFALKEAQKMLDVLGYDLVKRETAKSEAA